MQADIGIIGGSGFYEIMNIENTETKKIDTPFGDVTLTIGYLGNKTVAFLPRHGKKHTVPPHKINYRANVYAMYLLGVSKVISTSAVGSLKALLQPGDFLIPDQIIDLTKNRIYTFFDGSFKVRLHSGEERGGVYHVDVTNPYCDELRETIYSTATHLNLKIHYGGTYVCTEGPRFETPAEIRFFQMIGGDVVGMTNSPEVFLFKELDICYATICVITNYAAGLQKRVSHEEVIEIFKEKTKTLANLIFEVIKNL